MNPQPQPDAATTSPETQDQSGTLWTPTRIGRIEVSNRLAMSPMTRRRADADGRPTPRMVTYYTQRASFGMIVTEGTYPSVEGRAYPHQPGMLGAHTAGWSQVTEAVHQRGGRIVLQLMHAGRLTHPDITGVPTVLAPSAIGFAPDQAHAPHAAGCNPVPQAATTADIERLIAGVRLHQRGCRSYTNIGA